ncbi:MAG: prepilin peptidase [Bacillota bacterium]|nr:prepilin peptidase [Bacillota bacterium]
MPAAAPPPQGVPTPVWALALLAALVGLAAGSFLNTVIDRWIRGESLLRPPSHCESCGRRLEPWELVPLASWLALRGRCRSCGAAIGWQAPAVEAGTALLFAAVTATGRGWAETLLGLGLVALLVVATGVDLRVRLIPDAANGLAAGWALAIGFLARGGGFWPHLAAAAGAGLLFALIGRLSGGGLGGGDVKLAAVLGLFLGPAPAALAFFAAAVLGGGVAGFLLVTGRRSRRDELPFGPFLAAGALVAWFWAGPLIGLYLRWSGLGG